MPRSGKPSRAQRQQQTKHRGKPSHPQDAALIIFAKAPIPGQVKTRMCPPLSPDEAATLHGSLVMDAVERTRPLRGFDIFLACAPSKEHPFFQTLAARHPLELSDQEGETLGARMNASLTKILGQGYRFALLIGTDIPTLSHHTFNAAKDLLRSYDVVFGPTRDGGYYLVGLKHPTPELFSNVRWSTTTVLTHSLQLAESLGLTVGLLEKQRDLDTFTDLQAFMAEQKEDTKTKISNRTANVFQTLLQRHGTQA